MSQRRSKRRVQELSDEDELEVRSPVRRRARATSTDTNNTPRRKSQAKGKGRAIVADSDDDMEGDNDRDNDGINDGDGDDDDEVIAVQAYRPELERGEDGYVAGSIVRVKITGFMTYDHVEFNPGPCLNMILGPNGTGKSSIAAAIAIGLGFHPKVMGRAHDVRSYVKQGTEVAEIEIELKGRRRKANPVIWRRFGRDSDKSEWMLNGKTSTRKAVQNLLQSFGVQADNLCSFLPQDKVADFAKMNPVTVLKETMRAAGDPNLSQWHEDLVLNGRAAREVETSLTSKTQKLDTLRRQVTDLEPDVRNYERRMELQNQLLFAEVELQCVRYNAVTAEGVKHGKRAAKAREKLKRLEQKQAPLREQQDQQESKERKAKRGRERCEEELRRDVNGLAQAERSCRAAYREAESVAAELDTVNKKARQLRDMIKDVEVQIRKQEEILSTPESDKEAIRAQLDVKVKAQQKARSDERAADTRRQDQHAELERIRQELSEINANMVRLSQEEARHSNVEAQRRDAVFRQDPSVEFAVKWIEANQDKLRDRVLYPPLMSLNVPDKRYARLIESSMNAQARKTFVCQNQEDYATLLQLNRRPLPGGRTVQLSLATIEAANPGPPHAPPDQVADLGLDGFAVDFIEADPAMRTFLCQTAQFDRIGISLKPHNQLGPERLQRANIMTWISSTHQSRSVQSRYGNRAMQTTTNALPTGGRTFLGMTVDQDAVRRIADEMADCRRRQRALEEPQAKTKLEIEQSNKKIQAFRDAHTQGEDEIRNLRKELNKWELARTALERSKRRLRELKGKPTAEEERRALRDRVGTHAKDAFDAWKRFKASTSKMVERCGAFDKDVLAECQAASNARAVQDVSGRRQGEITELTHEADEERQAQKQAKHRAAELLQKVSMVLNQVPEESRDAARTRGTSSTKSVEAARAAIAEIQGALDLSLNVDGNTIERYNRLKGEFEDKERDVARTKSECEKLQTEVSSLLSRFNPALDSLVQETSTKFSAAFERIGCTGEVRVSRVQGNYEEWGIEILVSYRDGQDLEVLTASRQSGGERSLATVTYLMSLSEMARTPFSLVDEINQGMDARAERGVHNQMVQVTCAGGNTGQYFLITPKLLTGLDYHRAMRVLFVENGSHMPDPAVNKFGGLRAHLHAYKANIAAR